MWMGRKLMERLVVCLMFTDSSEYDYNYLILRYLLLFFYPRFDPQEKNQFWTAKKLNEIMASSSCCAILFLTIQCLSLYALKISLNFNFSGDFLALVVVVNVYVVSRVKHIENEDDLWHFDLDGERT